MELFVLLLPLLTALSFIFLFTRAKVSTTKTLPPGPIGLPIIGNTVQAYINFTNLHKYLADLTRTHGSFMSFKIGMNTTIVVSSSTIAKEVLLKHNSAFSNRFGPNVMQFLEHNHLSALLLPSSSSKRQILRNIYRNQLFTDKMLELIQNLWSQKVGELLSEIGKFSEQGTAIDVGNIVYIAIFNIMSNSIFSIGIADDERVPEMLDLLRCYLKELGTPNVVDAYPFLAKLDPQRAFHRTTTSCARLFKLFDDIIEERLKLRTKIADSSSSGALPRDLLDVILNIMDGQDGFNREEMLHLIFDIISTPMDAISRTTEWAMAELLRNPMVLSKCQEEIDTIVGRCKLVQYSDISKLPYMQAIVKETLRLHPAVPLFPRTAVKDVEVGGFTVRKGALIMVNAWAIGRDSEAWANSSVFSPERFLNSELDVKGQHFDLIPFGAGMRTCVGFPLALGLIPVILASLTGSYDWKLQSQSEEDFNMDGIYGVILRKAKPIHAFPIKRL